MHKAKIRDTQASRPPVISLVTLGCAKNLVDSERVLGALAEGGFLIAQDPAVAEICLVNTCGFISAAREETASVLRELVELKSSGSLRKVVALGCLVERVADAPEFERFLEAADARLGFKDYPRIVEICRELIGLGTPADPAGKGTGTVSLGTPADPAGKGTGTVSHTAAKRSQSPFLAPAPLRRPGEKIAPVPSSYNDFLVHPRMRIGSPHSAYLKISEGCSNPCRFCAIPRMRGLQVSRPIEAIVREAGELAAGGAVEVNLIAQDTTSYGRDLYGAGRLADLLRALKAVEGVHWLRLLYAYPRFLTDEMLDVLASAPRFCRYIDMPLQHIADPILRAMARGVTKQRQLELLADIQKRLPGCAVRTAFIVGFPGETEAHFQELLDFVNQGWFTHAGVFLYSHEPLTTAARLTETVPLAEKKARAEALMLAQREVSRRKMAARVGQTLEVLVDGPLEDAGDPPAAREHAGRSEERTGSGKSLRKVKAIGRSQQEAPEVDGVVYLQGRGAEKLRPGQFVQAKVVEGLDYDVVAELVS